MTGRFISSGLWTSFDFEGLIKRTAICASEYERTRFDHGGAPSSALIASKTVKRPMNLPRIQREND
jgi:hypothetical protein